MGTFGRFGWRRLAAMFVAVMLCSGAAVTDLDATAAASPGQQDPDFPEGFEDGLVPWDPADDPVAPPVPEVVSAERIESEGVEPATEVAWPAPGAADVSLAGVGERRRAGDLPLRVAAGSERASGLGLRVEVLDRAAAVHAGASGFVFTLSGEDGAAVDAGAVELAVDYSSFASAYGADYGGRLRVVALPACVLEPRVPAGCRSEGVLLPSRNDGDSETLVVEAGDLAGLVAPGLEVGVPVEEPADSAGTPPAPAPEESTTTEPSPGSTSTTAPEGSTATTTEAPSASTTTTSPTTSTTVGGDAGGAVPSLLTAPSSAQPSESSESVLLAVTSGPSGEGGDFRASPLAASSDWQVGVGSGEFGWDYPVPVPVAPAGESPSVAVAYSSSAVDGLTSTRNTQAGPVGLGFGDFANAFVERRYVTCSNDNALRNVLDLCWQSDNAVLSLNGRTAELIPTNRTLGPTTPKEWRLASDPRWRVQQVFGAAGDPANGDADKEWWKVTTPDGTEYWFGRGYNPDTPTQVTGSVFKVPVYGNGTGEPCSGAICDQGWRWNLDRVVDTNDNVTTYTYAQETNKYLAIAGLAGERSYTRAGQLKTIEYGAHTGSPAAGPQARVEFAIPWRCASLSDKLEPDPTACTEPKTNANPATYPDVPVDLLCVDNTSQCTTSWPSFFTARRYEPPWP